MISRKTISSFLFIPLLFIAFACSKESGKKLYLVKDWQFKQSGTDDWKPAIIPGSVHVDLLNQKKIEDPFFGNNEQKLQWISEKDWEYKTQFKSGDLLNFDYVNLIFEGIDTYADVYLNDSLMLIADNMFRQWTIDLKGILQPGNNNLHLKFYSPENIDKEKASALKYKLPDDRGHTRKAPYQYGWDWGPKFVTSGIWKPVYISAWNEAKIKNIQVIQKDISEQTAKFTGAFEINSAKDQDGIISVYNNQTDQLLTRKVINLGYGVDKYLIDFSIDNPKLWWPNGLGDQHLYTIKFELETPNAVDVHRERIGIRSIELIQESRPVGSTFYFEVNGYPVFMKGANYIPSDNFLSRTTPEKYEEIIKASADANMNMLRVWGGGIYENDHFYDLCDEYGLLVWQDFMFACNMYPGDSLFLENVKQEAIQNIKRLRNHPSIALWCGNNEISEGWFNWGWQKSLEYSNADSLEVWNNYLKIFEIILPGVVKDYDKNRSYWPSSPKTGWGHEQSLYSGDIHYWGVWWGEEPFEIYEKKVGRFMSEYGFQGFPALSTLDSCLNIEDLTLESEALLNHQKHPRGMELIQKYMERDFIVPGNFQDYAYVSQLVQAYGIKIALEAHRRAKPYCMGTLYWQLNDCWPVISWSSVDYFNNWKALHYFAKNAFREFLISFEENENEIRTHIISDRLTDAVGELYLRIIDFEGNEVWSKTRTIELEANTSKVYANLDVPEINRNKHLLSAQLFIADSLISSNTYYFTVIKDMELPTPDIQKEIIKAENGYQIILSSDKLAKNVFLSTKGEGFFSDNYFDLLPFEEKKVIFHSDSEKDHLLEDLKIISLFDTL